jgi:NRAMP (natural resistance-associated macrophage protein)-like metal ion transporter
VVDQTPQSGIETSKARRGAFRQFFADLGPGLITGAADDDPSGISTYSVAGASLGYAGLWTALFSFPLMAAVQLMCARLGMVTGRGLAGVIRLRYPRWVLRGACALLLAANIFNIAADLGGMSDAMEMVTGRPSWIWTPLFTVGILALLFLSSYRTIARVFKWLTLVLFAYIIAAFLAHPDWSKVLISTVVPHIQWTGAYASVLVGILGTTISPYLFFWQAAQEVEQETQWGRATALQRKGATDLELKRSRIDVITGMFFSNLVMYFIILTTAATLHEKGVTTIDTARQAADALRPLAGNGAYWLFTLGLIGTGTLAVPVLAGSCAYAIAEAFRWRKASLEEKPHLAPRFYGVIACSMLLGLALDFAGLNAVKMLFWSAILNGLLAPPLVVLVVLLTCDKRIMGKHVNPPVLRILGWTCAAVMTLAGIAMLVL